MLFACASTKHEVSKAPEQKQPEAAAPQKAAEESAPEFPPGDPDVGHEAFLRYLYLTHLGENDIALEFLRHASFAEPSNRYLTYTLAEQLLERKEYAEALLLAERGKNLPGKPNSGEYGILATLYVHAGFPDSAKVYYKKLLDENEEDYEKIYEYTLFLEMYSPDDEAELIRAYSILSPRVHYMRPMFSRLAQLLLKNGREDEYRTLLDEAFAETHDVSYLREKCLFYGRLGKADSAMVVAKRMYDEFPQNGEVVAMYGALLVGENRGKESLETMRKFIEGGGEKTPKVLYLTAASAEMVGEWKEAKQYYSECVKFPDFEARCHAQLSELALRDKDFKTALAELELADSLANGGYEERLYRLYVRTNQPEKAFPPLDSLISVLRSVVKLDSAKGELADSSKAGISESDLAGAFGAISAKLYRTILLEAELYVERGGMARYNNPDSAKAFYGKAAALTDEVVSALGPDADVMFFKASILERMGETDASIALFRDLVKKDSANHLAMNYLGYTLIDENRNARELDEGIALVERALKLRPNTPSYLDSKAWGLFRKGDFKAALEIMEGLPSKDAEIADDAVYWEHLGRILDSLGETSRAQECFEKLGEIEPSHPFAKKPAGKKKGS